MMKRLMTRYILTAICTSLLCLPSVQASSPQAQRSLFQQTYAELQKGDTAGFGRLPADMHQYPLYPWLEYGYLTQTFDNAADTQIVDFIQRNPNSLMSNELIQRLATRLAAKADWQKLLAYIPADMEDTDTQCYRVQALAAAGQTEQALTSGKQTWMDIDKSITDACRPVTELLLQHQRLNVEDYWSRIRTAIDKNQTTLATQLAADLPPEQQEWVRFWINMCKAPSDTMALALKQKDSPFLREIMVSGLALLAKKDAETAEALWKDARQTFKFTPTESGKVESALGISQALRNDPAALPRLAAIPAEYRTQDGNLWLTRSAARAGDWKHLPQAIDHLKFDNDRDASGWQYWKARALEQDGQTKAANSLYAAVAQHTTFYGLLAADRLGQDYTSLQQPAIDRSQRVAGLQKVAALQRTVEWFALGNRAQGRKEWFNALKQMDKEGILAAADLALQAGDPNLAIWTIARAKEWDEVNLRFPLVHTDLVTEQAREQGIQPAWIMGIMRRESAFDASAESGAKAVGLMQLIPPTAKAVGRKLGLSINGKEDMLSPATNIKLGSAYLKDMLGKFNGNYAQATAAYNAGPGRPVQWAPATAINADQWIESIPFTETREYVQAVMSYTTIYDYKLNQGKGRRLSERLPPITPNAPTTPPPLPTP
jgi:soluble lytic murein transglycosylase